MTRVGTITGLTRFPKAKKSRTSRKTLACPCCCQALPLEEAEDPDLWAKHMKNDISPYTYIVENYPTPYKFYVTRNEWREHVLRDHPPKWRCSCCLAPRPVFQSLRSFIVHLDEKHEDQISDENFERVMGRSTFRTFGITKCLLCDYHGPTDSPELIEHALGHVYDFSMYSLPWRTTPQKSLKKPIRTFNDIAPVLEPNHDEHATEMRMFSHNRVLEWVEEPHGEEVHLTPEQMATIRDLDWDDYQAMDDEDGADSVEADYFDRAELDYFEDDASSRGTSSRADHSASTRQLYSASSSGTSSSTYSPKTASLKKTFDNLIESGHHHPDLIPSPELYGRLIKTRKEQESPEYKLMVSEKAAHEGDIAARAGNLNLAMSKYHQALEGYEPILGPKDKLILDIFASLGGIYAKQFIDAALQAEFSLMKVARLEAESMYRRALQGYEETLGPKDKLTLDTAISLGDHYAMQGKEDAEAMYHRALQGYSEERGPNDKLTLDTARSLGNLYARRRCKQADAEAMYHRALQGYEELGLIDIALDTIELLADIYARQGKLVEAEAMYHRALQGYEAVLGPKHIRTLNTAASLDGLYAKQGKPGRRRPR